MSLELTYVKLETLTNGGTVLNSEDESSDFPLVSHYNAISERKRLTFAFNNVAEGYDQQSVEGASLYINFAMFLPIGFIYSEPTGPPNTGFNLMIPATLGANETHLMYFYCFGNPGVRTNNNFKCSFVSASELSEVNNKFAIVLEYYNTFDEGTYFNSTDKNNQWRFMAEFFDQLNFNMIPDSVYRTTKEFRAIVMLQSEFTTKAQFPLVQLQAQTFNAPSQWTFGTEGYTEISSAQDTDVVVLVKTASTNDDYYVKIFRDQNDTSLDFVANYDIGENKIAVGSIDNILKGPFSSNTVVIEGESYRELKFKIDKDFITAGTDYRMIGIGYDDYYLSPIVFISPLIKVQPAHPYDGNGIDFTGSISDIQREFYGDDLTAVIDERLRSKIYLDYAYDKYKNDIFNRMGIVISNDVRNFLETVTVEIYEEYFDADLDGTVKVLLESSVLRRAVGGAYVGEAIVADFYDNGAQFHYVFRNRSDADSVPISVTLDGDLYYSSEIGNQYWGGKDLFIKWSFSFPYAEFTDVIEYVQKLSVKDYSDDLQITRTGSGIDYTFPGNDLCYQAELTSDIPEYNAASFLLMNMVRSPVLSIVEEEGFEGAELPQQQNDIIINQDVLFSDQKAAFCLDTNQLTVGQEYTTISIAKKNYSYAEY